MAYRLQFNILFWLFNEFMCCSCVENILIFLILFYLSNDDHLFDISSLDCFHPHNYFAVKRVVGFFLLLVEAFHSIFQMFFRAENGPENLTKDRKLQTDKDFVLICSSSLGSRCFFAVTFNENSFNDL